MNVLEPDVSEDSKDPFFVTGGALASHARCYIARQADDELYTSLINRVFCHILTSRQVGKTSLLFRTAERLVKDGGTRVIILPITVLGQNVTPEEWYLGMLHWFGEQTNLKTRLDEFWAANRDLGPLLRLMEALKAVILKSADSPLVIFIDEIDAIQGLQFPADEFMAAIREMHNRRVFETDLQRLTFCLVGSANPGDLIQDKRMTPFNISHPIQLSDFTEREMSGFCRGLQCHIAGENELDREEKTTVLLHRIWHWTSGQPYLTQRLCRSLSERFTAATPKDVDALCEQLFFNRQARGVDSHLTTLRDRIIQNEKYLLQIISLYKRVRSGLWACWRFDPSDPTVDTLCVAGLIKSEREGYLSVRNNVYRKYFNRKWIKKHSPGSELRRYHLGYWRGFVTSTVGLTTIAFLACVLVGEHWIQKVKDGQTNKTINQLNADKATLGKTIWDSKNNEFLLIKNVNNLRSNYDFLLVTYERLGDNSIKFSNAVNNLSDKNSQLISRIGEISNSYTYFKSENIRLSRETLDMSNETNELTLKVSDLSRRLNALIRKSDDLSGELSSTKSNLNFRLRELTNQVVGLQRSKTSLEGNVSILQRDLSSESNKVTSSSKAYTQTLERERRASDDLKNLARHEIELTSSLVHQVKSIPNKYSFLLKSTLELRSQLWTSIGSNTLAKADAQEAVGVRVKAAADPPPMVNP